MTETYQHKAPFVIRGHHIDYLTPLVPPMGLLPEYMARELRADSTRDRGSITHETVEWRALTNPKNDLRNHRATYAYDLVGETEDQADRFENSLAETLRIFTSLADEAPVSVTARGMDGICDACTFKNHCRLPDEAAVDEKYLEVFEDVLDFARSKDEALDVSATRTEQGDILTTAKAIRRVMAHFAIAKLWQGSLYRDALHRREIYGNVFAGPDMSEVERYYQYYGDEIGGSAGWDQSTLTGTA